MCANNVNVQSAMCTILVCVILSNFIRSVKENEFVCRVFCPRMQNWGLNTYLYGPKDDLKHRLLWREVYSPEEEGKTFLFLQFGRLSI